MAQMLDTYLNRKNVFATRKHVWSNVEFSRHHGILGVANHISINPQEKKGLDGAKVEEGRVIGIQTGD